jgi:AhpD family alkylhydroperoxidase
MGRKPIDYATVVPEALTAMLGLERVVHASALEPLLLELVKLRASQINGCARCIEMHTKDARALGEAQERLDLVAAWTEAPSFTRRERAALGWCEVLTRVADVDAAGLDDAFREIGEQFDEREIVELTLAVATINTWNRLNVGLRAPVGDYVSRYGSRGRDADEL